MLKSMRAAAWVMVGITCLGVVTITGCGGGGTGSGGSGSLPQFLATSNTLFFGFRQGGTNTLAAFPGVPANGVPVPAGGSYTVGSARFTSGVGGRQDFLQITFNTLLNASTVFSTPPNGNDGIVVFRQTTTPGGLPISTPQAMSLDPTGIADSSNVFPSAGVAPATLRIYVNTDGNLSTAEAFQPGQYVLTINNSLKSFTNGPFCVNTTGSNCVNTYLPVIPFTVGADATPLAMNQPTASIPAQNDVAVPVNSEIVLNFGKAVDFISLVGRTPNNPTGVPNTTTLDPFCSIPRPIAYVANCNMGQVPAFIPPFANIGNLFVNYNRPTDPTSGQPEPPPVNLGFIAYMPDPFLNPTQVRIRFVDIAALQGRNNVGANQFQNYASNPTKLPIASQNPALNAAILQLPPILPVPGSLPGYNSQLAFADGQAAVLDVFLMSPTFGIPPSPPFPAPPTGMPAPPNCYASVLGGITDRPDLTVTPQTANGLIASSGSSDFWLRCIWARGPALARNPMPPDATFVGAQQGALKGIATVNTAGTTTSLNGGASNTQIPVTYGSTVLGTTTLSPNRLANGAVLGTPLDIEVGHFLATQLLAQQANNSMTNPGRGAVNTPGVPDSQNGTTPTGLRNLVAGPFPPPVQPWGNFLYVVDGDSNSLKVFNGYNFQLISTIVGLASPAGLGIAPNLEFLYVSNQNEGTVTRIFSNPNNPNFHAVAGIVQVGPGPRSVSVQPANEDVLVANFAGNSFSLISTGTQQIRATFADPGAIGPTDIFITQRMLGIALTQAYTAFITNFFSDDVTIYESNSFAVPENSLNGVVKAKVGGFHGPGRGTWNWQTYTQGANGAELGCFIANALGQTVDELTMQSFTLSPPPNFPGPSGMRNYHILKSLNGSAVPGVNTSGPSDASIDNHSGLYNINVVGATNNKNACDPSVGAGVPSVVLVSYPSAGVVAAFTYGTGSSLLGSTSVPGCDFLQSYYDQ